VKQAIAQRPVVESHPNPGLIPAASQESGAPLHRRVSVEFEDTPLEDVLSFLGNTLDGQFYLNRKRLNDEEIAADAPVSLRLKNVRADMVLDLALDQVSDSLAYVVRDEIVMVSTLDDLEGAAEVRVYNVRDLLKLTPPQDAGAMAPGMGGPSGYPGGDGGYGAYGAEGYGSMGAGMDTGYVDRGQLLTDVLTAAIGHNHWQKAGGYGTIAAYDGLLVVNHNTRIHQQVERLLEMLRAAAHEPQPPAATGMPGLPAVPGSGGFPGEAP
jgi:hypothetical protein